MKPLPPTGVAMLDLLAANGGSIDYHDPRVPHSGGATGLTALRHRGLAKVESGRNHPPLIRLTDEGRWAWNAARGLDKDGRPELRRAESKGETNE